jgi:hypothetical protein
VAPAAGARGPGRWRGGVSAATPPDAAAPRGERCDRNRRATGLVWRLAGPGATASRSPRLDRGSRPPKLTRAGAGRDPWRVLGPMQPQPASRARGRVVLAGCACRTTRTGTRRPFALPDRGNHTSYPAPAAPDRRPDRALDPHHTSGPARARRPWPIVRAPRGARPAGTAHATAAAPRNHPQIGDSTQSRGSAAAAQPAARPPPRLGFLAPGQGSPPPGIPPPPASRPASRRQARTDGREPPPN